MMKKNNFIKNKKGFSLAQVLFYAILGVTIFTVFFTFVGTSRSANMSFVHQNDMLYQVYNIEEQMLKDIKNASEIQYYTNKKTDPKYQWNYICAKGDTNCDNTKIKLVDRSGNFEKEYAFKDGKIVLTDNKNSEVPQYDYVESATFELVQNSGYDIKAIEIHIKFKKASDRFDYKVTIAPNVWINKTIDPTTGGLVDEK